MAERPELISLIEDPERFLSHEDPKLRRMAATALGSASSPTGLEAVSHLLSDEDASVRAAAAETLGVHGEVSIPLLVKASEDPDPRVREAVATAYGSIADPSVIDWLVDAGQNDPDRTVKEAAVAALGAVGNAEAVDPLLGFMAAGPPQVRRRAIAAITVFDDPRIEPAIQRAALDRNPGVREAAEMVVGKQLVADA